MVAIILVNYNGAQDTIECVESLSKMAFNDICIIVVENKSTDDSLLRLKTAQRLYNFYLLEAQNNNGFAAGNNMGIQYASQLGAGYYWLLNNDTIVEANTLTELLEGFELNSRIGLTIGKILYEKNRDRIWYAGGSTSHQTARTEHWQYGEKNDGKVDGTQPVSFATGCCMLIKKDVVDKIGRMDESYFLYEEDTDYCFRVVKAGFSIYYCPEAIIYHKVSASTGQASPLSQYYMIRNKYLMIQQHFQGINKVMAYLYTSLQMCFRCLKGELAWKNYWLALQAFWNKEKGKRGAPL